MVENMHYIPRLILSSFSDKLNYFDIKNNTLEINKKIKNIFYEKSLYSERIEKLISTKVEGPCADLIKNKILKSNNQVVLTREEVLLLKKFLILQYIRTSSSDKINSLSLIQNLMGFKEKTYNRNFSGYSDETFEKNIETLINMENIEKGMKDLKDSFLFHDIIAFYNSYICIWDSTDSKEDFVLCDDTSASYSPQETQQLMLHLMQKSRCLDYFKQNVIHQLIQSSQPCGFTFITFPISSTRAIVVVNPLMKIFDKKGQIYNILGNLGLNFPEIFDYSSSTIIEQCQSNKDNSIKKYPIIKISKNDVLLTNACILNEAIDGIAFRNFENIKNSILNYQSYDIRNHDYSEILKQMNN